MATILISRFAGARIVEEWVVRDMLGLLQQVGAAPLPEAVAAAVVGADFKNNAWRDRRAVA